VYEFMANGTMREWLSGEYSSVFFFSNPMVATSVRDAENYVLWF